MSSRVPPPVTQHPASGGPRRRRRPGLPPATGGVLLACGLLGMLPGSSAAPAAGLPASVPPAAATETASPPVSLRGALPDSRFVPEWSWPLSAAPAVLRPFAKPAQKWKPGHRGVDLAAGPGSTGDAGGTVVLAPADGIVSFAGTVVDRGVLSIDHGDGRVSSFEPVTTGLAKGGSVRRGEAVAALAATAGAGASPGHCGRPCLHWGVREHGEYVDPLSFVMDRRPSVLLPLDGSG